VVVGEEWWLQGWFGGNGVDWWCIAG